MKLIAHRGASLEFHENTIESLMRGAELGAYAVECDVRRAVDGKFIIHHDADLKRLAGVDAKIADLTYPEAAAYHKAAGRRLITVDDISDEYRSDTPVLLHVNCPVDDDFVSMLKKTRFNYICGMTSAAAVETLAVFLLPEQILGFLPSPAAAGDFIERGAGMVRLWEQWLPEHKPADIKKLYPDTEVWIMARLPGNSMNGTPESLDYFRSLGADGVLLNDIAMAAKWLEDTKK